MSNSKQREIPFRGNLHEILKQLAKDGPVVDVVLNRVPYPEEYRKIVFRETLGTRIIHVGDDYIILGPKRPISNCVIPIEEVLLVRLAEEERRLDEDIIDDKIAKGHAGWEAEWVRDEDARSLTPDGVMHNVDYDSLEDLPHDIPLAIFVSDETKPSMKLAKTLVNLANEYDDDVLFIQTDANEKLLKLFKIRKVPAVVVRLADKTLRVIDGIASTGEYRTALGNALSKLRSGGYY